VDTGARRELEILKTLAEGRPVTQRALARRLGIALGLTNLYLKRLVRKGYVKITTIPRHRLKYLVTPRGVAQKTRLSYEYLHYSLRLYREAREALRETLAPLVRSGERRIALYGTGEAAVLAYLTLREMGIEPAAILDGQDGGCFLGQPVRSIDVVTLGDYERIVVATLALPDGVVAELERRGVPRAHLIGLRW
jgi:DNA-binding MarR family transcriptional regulator